MANQIMKIIDNEKKGKSSKEDQLYNDAVIALEKINIYSKVKLLQKMAEDYGLDKPYYCSACTEISQVNWDGMPEFQHCSKCCKSFCEGCCHEGEDSPTTFCDKCEAIFCRECATREMANKIYCKNCRNKKIFKRRGKKNIKNSEKNEIEFPMSTFLFEAGL